LILQGLSLPSQVIVTSGQFCVFGSTSDGIFGRLPGLFATALPSIIVSTVLTTFAWILWKNPKILFIGLLLWIIRYFSFILSTLSLLINVIFQVIYVALLLKPKKPIYKI